MATVPIKLHPIGTKTSVAYTLILGHVDANVGAQVAVTPVCLGLVKQTTGEDLQVHCAADVVLDHLHPVAVVPIVPLVHLVDGPPSPVVPNKKVLVDGNTKRVSRLE